jgi:hypothetical protein
MSNEIALRGQFSIQDISVMANAAAKSRLFPGIDTVEQATCLMMICNAESIHPMKALQRYHIVKGRPTWKSSALLAAFKERGGKYKFTIRTDKQVTCVFEKDGNTIEITWDAGRAKNAGLLGKDVWINYPCQMLTARAISEGVDLCDPAIKGGFMTSEEVQDIPDDETVGQRVKRRIRQAAEAEVVAQAVDPGQEPTDSEKALSEVLEQVDTAATLSELDNVVKVTHKLIISAMSEADKGMVESAYKTKKKLMMFGTTPGTTVTDESSAHIMQQYVSTIAKTSTMEAALLMAKSIDAIKDQVNALDLSTIADAYKAKVSELSVEAKAPEPETKAPIPETIAAVPETTKTEPFPLADGPGTFHADVQARMAAMATEDEKKAEYAKASATLMEGMLKDCEHIKTRAMADKMKNMLEDNAGRLTREDYFTVNGKIEMMSAAIKTPIVNHPKKLEQAVLPGIGDPAPKQEKAIMSYGAKDQEPDWVKVGQDVTVSACPGGAPYLTTKITGPVFVESVSMQKCVAVANVSYPVPVACLKKVEA